MAPPTSAPLLGERVGVASLFSGVGGIDLGLSRGDGRLAPCLFCEINADAQRILASRFPGVPIHDDVATLDRLPEEARVVVAGSPCCDFSSANTEKRGLAGEKSSLLLEVFRLLEGAPWVEHVVVENVANMLRLKGGEAMEEMGKRLSALGFSYCYRVVDARAFGLRQRRRRLVCVARKGADPPTWLVRDSVPTPTRCAAEERPSHFSSFSWIDGNRGCGFVNDVVPTLRAHDSPVLIPSQPAVIFPASHHVGILSPEDGEALQGLPEGWTGLLSSKRRFARIGNSVPVPVFEWIGARLLGRPSPDDATSPSLPPLPHRRAVPVAGVGTAFSTSPPLPLSAVTEWPPNPFPGRVSVPPSASTRLSKRAISGFLKRAEKGKSGMPGWALAILKQSIVDDDARS